MGVDKGAASGLIVFWEFFQDSGLNGWNQMGMVGMQNTVSTESGGSCESVVRR